MQTEETLVVLLPSNLEFMVYRQCADWLRNQIVVNHTERGYSGQVIVYGDEEWHPDFWLDEIFPWSSMTNFNNIRASDYTGDNNLTWFLTKIIERRLHMKGLILNGREHF